MKDFNDFVTYYLEHNNELLYDTKAYAANAGVREIPFGVEVAQIAATIAQAHTLALLRQYHNWLAERE